MWLMDYPYFVLYDGWILHVFWSTWFVQYHSNKWIFQIGSLFIIIFSLRIIDYIVDWQNQHVLNLFFRIMFKYVQRMKP